MIDGGDDTIAWRGHVEHGCAGSEEIDQRRAGRDSFGHRHSQLVSNRDSGKVAGDLDALEAQARKKRWGAFRAASDRATLRSSR